MILDCGHSLDPKYTAPGYQGASGYARTPDDRRICYSCSDARERDALRTADKYTAYLSGDASQITTWPGGNLADVTRCTVRKVGFGGSRAYFRAVDIYGGHWHGNSAGPHMVATMRRVKVATPSKLDSGNKVRSVRLGRFTVSLYDLNCYDRMGKSGLGYRVIESGKVVTECADPALAVYCGTGTAIDSNQSMASAINLICYCATHGSDDESLDAGWDADGLSEAASMRWPDL